MVFKPFGYLFGKAFCFVKDFHFTTSSFMSANVSLRMDFRQSGCADERRGGSVSEQ